MINAHTFSATPTPAEAMTPMEFTMARMIRKETITLMIWANTVARAAPDVPIPITAHKSRSPTILQTQAIATVISGVLESPNPLNIQPIRL